MTPDAPGVPFCRAEAEAQAQAERNADMALRQAPGRNVSPCPALSTHTMARCGDFATLPFDELAGPCGQQKIVAYGGHLLGLAPRRFEELQLALERAALLLLVHAISSASRTGGA